MADKKYVRRDLVEREILKHAKRLFAERGFDSTSLNEIAEAVGVTRSAIYYYVDSKEALLVAVVEGAAEQVRAGGLESIELSTLTPTERLGHVVRTFVHRIAEDPLRWQTLARCGQHLPPEIREKHELALEDGTGAFEALLAEGVASGEFRPLNPEISAQGLLGMCHWVVASYSDDAVISADELGDELAELAVRSVRRHDVLHHRNGDVLKAIGSLRNDVAELEQLLGHG